MWPVVRSAMERRHGLYAAVVLLCVLSRGPLSFRTYTHQGGFVNAIAGGNSESIENLLIDMRSLTAPNSSSCVDRINILQCISCGTNFNIDDPGVSVEDASYSVGSSHRESSIRTSYDPFI